MLNDDHLLNELQRVPQDEHERMLVARYAPLLHFDVNEPFLPLAAGYTIFRANGISPSTPRSIMLATPERPSTTLAIEYAIWWDWDIGHLYELEHVWIYVDTQGSVVDCEASWHGGHHRMARNGIVAMHNERAAVWSEPGKHAFAPDPSWFAERAAPHRRTVTRDLAGAGGVLIPAMFADQIARAPWHDTLARSYLTQHAFEPTWNFDRSVALADLPLVPWHALAAWIPQRVRWWLARLDRELPPADYRPLRIGHRHAPAGGLGNTLAGIRRAAARGCDMVGVNARSTLDGVLIAAPAALVRDTAGQRWSINMCTLAELRALDLNDDGAAFPTLQEVGACCMAERVGLYIALDDSRAAPGVAAAIQASGLADFTIVGAARADWLAEIKSHAPALQTAIEFESPHVDGILLAQAAGADYLFPCWAEHEVAPRAQISADWVARAHAAGLGVIGWHSGRPEVRAAIARSGFDAVCDVGRPAPLTAEERAARHVLAVCLDCGDTLVDEGSEIKDERDATQRADLIPGAAALVRELARRGYRLALVADGPAATFANALTQHGLYDLFDVFAISEQVGVVKPDRQIFVHALDQLGLAPADYGRVLMLGNYLARDIKGANARGLISVWLNWGPRRPKTPADLSEVPRYTIRQPLDLLTLLDYIEQEHTRQQHD